MQQRERAAGARHSCVSPVVNVCTHANPQRSWRVFALRRYSQCVVADGTDGRYGNDKCSSDGGANSDCHMYRCSGKQCYQDDEHGAFPKADCTDRCLVYKCSDNA
jgi:hypothetical protein